jgi:hypothetical protein
LLKGKKYMGALLNHSVRHTVISDRGIVCTSDATGLSSAYIQRTILANALPMVLPALFYVQINFQRIKNEVFIAPTMHLLYAFFYSQGIEQLCGSCLTVFLFVVMFTANRR